MISLLESREALPKKKKTNQFEAHSLQSNPSVVRSSLREENVVGFQLLPFFLSSIPAVKPDIQFSKSIFQRRRSKKARERPEKMCVLVGLRGNKKKKGGKITKKKRPKIPFDWQNRSFSMSTFHAKEKCV